MTPPNNKPIIISQEMENEFKKIIKSKLCPHPEFVEDFMSDEPAKCAECGVFMKDIINK